MRKPMKSLAAFSLALASVLTCGTALAYDPYERVVIVLEYRMPDGTIKPAVFDSQDDRITRMLCNSVIYSNLPTWKRQVAKIPEFADLEYVDAKCVAWSPEGLEGIGY